MPHFVGDGTILTVNKLFFTVLFIIRKAKKLSMLLCFVIHYYFYYLSATPEAWLQEVSISVQDALWQCNSKCGPQPCNSNSSWELVRNTDPWAPCHTFESKPLGLGLQFNKLSIKLHAWEA